MSLRAQTSETLCGIIKQASARAHMCQSVRSACLKRRWEPTCEGVRCLPRECARRWGSGRFFFSELCRADGGAPCASPRPTGLPVDATSVNISVCGEKVAGREALLRCPRAERLIRGAAAPRPVTEDVVALGSVNVQAGAETACVVAALSL